MRTRLNYRSMTLTVWNGDGELPIRLTAESILYPTRALTHEVHGHLSPDELYTLEAWRVGITLREARINMRIIRAAPLDDGVLAPNTLHRIGIDSRISLARARVMELCGCYRMDLNTPAPHKKDWGKVIVRRPRALETRRETP